MKKGAAYKLTAGQYRVLRAVHKIHPTAWVNLDVGDEAWAPAVVVRALATKKLVDIRKDSSLPDRFCRLTKAGLALARLFAGV